MKDFKNKVVYQIYPKSFNDSNGDGIGDLRGVTKKLDYLKTLGIDYIWLTPFCVSPQKDNGYDVEDYCSIDPRFGTMEDFETLVSEAKKSGIEIMMDMVFNHTSTEHKWFKSALKGDEKYKNYYIFKKSKDNKAPTNWESKFGGSAWEYVKELDEYYLHLFDVTQADLNWENEELRKEVYNIVNFWIEKGVKGFRLDVINLISKPDRYEDDYIGDGRHFYTDGVNIHKYLKELNKETFGRYEDSITVGEMSSTTIESCIKYSNPEEKELSMVFNFHHLKVDYKNGDKWTLMDFDFESLKEIFSLWQSKIQEGNGWSAVFWCNHDQPRAISRFGDDKKYPVESGKMLATAIHMLRGTPYIYQGEEFGMTNSYFDKIDDYRDIESINYYNILKEQGRDEKEIMSILEKKSRDNSRTPIQWNEDKNAGFTTGTPWISIGKNSERINAEAALNDKNSIFYYYQKLIKLRKEYRVISEGDFVPILKEHKEVFAYIRELNKDKLLVVNNFYGKDTTFELPEEFGLHNLKTEILISNYDDSSEKFTKIKLRPYESIVYLIEK